MMRYDRLLLTLLIVLMTLAPARAQNVSLVGTLHTSSGGPVIGASVYVTRIKGTNGNSVSEAEIGPVGSSSSGQFVFYNLSPGEYKVRIAVAGTTVWQGTARVPGQLTPIVLH